MVEFKEIEHHDTFEDTTTYWCVATNIPHTYVEEAKKIDKENYNPDCFGACVIEDKEGFCMCQDKEGSELFYIDTDGEKHWMKKKLTEEEAKTFYGGCMEEMLANM